MALLALTVGAPAQGLRGAGGPVRFTPQASLPSGGSTIRIDLATTRSGIAEHMIVGLPSVLQPGSQVPTLVLFHGYGEFPADLTTKTDFFDEATSRGWLVVAPLGANRFNFGIDYAQDNTEDALEVFWSVFQSFLDPDRIYGVGFSMGAGWASSYAARHVGNDDLAFAAQLLHTGTLSLTDLSFRIEHKDQILFEGMTEPPVDFDSNILFGATLGPERHFRMCRSSVIDMAFPAAPGWSAPGFSNDPFGSEADLADPDLANVLDRTSMAWNLKHLVQAHTWATDDDNEHLTGQTEVARDFVQTVVGQIPGQPLPPSLDPQDAPAGCPNQHCWDFLDESDTLDWLELHTRVTPDPTQPQRLRMDEDRQWHGFEVRRTGARRIASMLYAAVPDATVPVSESLNAVQIEFLDQLTARVPDLGLEPSPSPGDTLTVYLDPVRMDAVPDMGLEGLTVSPSSITVTYNAPSGSVTVPANWTTQNGVIQIDAVNQGAAPISWNRFVLTF